MYTVIKNTQIVIALLKEYDIKHIVISPGTRNGPFVHSVEEDPYFKCYSVVDERSAAFFALGIAKQLGEPVVISCTSSTAACNYYSAVTEAYYSNIPLVILTSDRNPYTRNQLEKQQIEQVNMYGKMCRKCVDLPMKIKDSEDFWYCERLVNEALLELNHHSGGPIQINLPVYNDMKVYTEKELPKVKRIFRNEIRRQATKHELGLIQKLHNAKRIMLVVGSCPTWTQDLKNKLQTFLNKYNCVLISQHMSNIGIPEEKHIMAGTDICNCLENNIPDILISCGGPTQLMIFEKFKNAPMEFWQLNGDGVVQDPTRRLKEIFECSINDFLDFFIEHADASWINDKLYDTEISNSWEQFWNSRPQLDKFTNIYAIREFTKLVPENSMVSMSILNSIRIVETYPLANNVDVYANVGAYGIDGCMSTFIGQASVIDRPAYLVTGDLSFIYDINSIWIRHIADNVHILLINNYEGIEMRRSYTAQGDLRRHITAGHNVSPRGWIEDNGFIYFKADSKKELEEVLPKFISSNKKCVLEVFTDAEDDTNTAIDFYSYNSENNIKKLKNVVRSVIGDNNVYKLKRILGKK